MTFTVLLLLASLPSAIAAQFDIPGPPGSIEFGAEVAVLPNGNIVVVDPEGPGAVHLYGTEGVLISTLTGGKADDRIGNRGITVLGSGHFVVSSTNWDSDTIINVGAVTWINADTGLNGVVSATNSLVGSSIDDRVGDVTALENGNYVVSSPNWSNGGIEAVGAVTWANGNSGLSGPVSPANSLIGSTADDQIGNEGVVALSNGNYVVASASW
ncbi:hypothetical protein, partial [Dokdonella sp.]|uniref:hypothetical protein n=1 Tax=Dokdonella sp. TaxID=2291710 RepID=UPI003C64FD42